MPRLQPRVHAAHASEPAVTVKRPAGSTSSATWKHSVVRRSSTDLIPVIQDARSRHPLRRTDAIRELRLRHGERKNRSVSVQGAGSDWPLPDTNARGEAEAIPPK